MILSIVAGSGSRLTSMALDCRRDFLLLRPFGVGGKDVQIGQDLSKNSERRKRAHVERNAISDFCPNG